MLPSANSWLGVARNGSAIVGPAIAAALYHTAGRRSCGAIDAGSFLVSAARALARPAARLHAGPQLGMRRELVEGFRYVLSVPWIWTGIAAATVILMIAMAPFTALLPRLVQVALPPRRRLVRRALQRDGRRDGGRLARLGAVASARATA